MVTAGLGQTLVWLSHFSLGNRHWVWSLHLSCPEHQPHMYLLSIVRQPPQLSASASHLYTFTAKDKNTLYYTDILSWTPATHVFAVHSQAASAIVCQCFTFVHLKPSTGICLFWEFVKLHCIIQTYTVFFTYSITMCVEQIWRNLSIFDSSSMGLILGIFKPSLWNTLLLTFVQIILPGV